MEKLSDRMKEYERKYSYQFLDKEKPLIARIDGRSFSKLTKTRCFKKPFDKDFSNAMIETTTFLMEETNAVFSYTQSDEISLIFYNKNQKSQHWFNGKQQKMVSQLAALASVKFLTAIRHKGKARFNLPTFDCRLFEVPNKEEATNYILWRERDAIKNSISMYARSSFSHKQLEGVNSNGKLNMLDKKGNPWDRIDKVFRRGAFVGKKTISQTFSEEELKRLPTRHHARLNPNQEYIRTTYDQLLLPKMSTIENRVGVIFDGEDYILKELDEA